MSDAACPEENDRFVESRSEGSLPVGDLFELLANDRRRWAVRYLIDRPGTRVPVDGVVDFLVTEGFGRDARDVKIALEHVHLPKLASSGVIAYDEREGRVRYEGDAGLEFLLDVVRGENSR